ncbi:MAG TPA: lysophospholipid acyltransferase family protein [Polyangiaceae bacterium]|nr:lysophospholipid acyltransferase family protein [Polyangiaceae bacterium]
MRLSRPTQEQLETLTRMERAAFEIGDFWARHLVPASKAYDTVVMGALLWSTASRRLHVHDLHHLSRFRAPERVLIVCNHRTFFDFFVITAVVYWRTRLSHRILFPVRSSFFYDHPLGPAVNIAMSGMRMFPPVLRGENVRRRATFNEYSVQRSIEELSQPGTVMGLHPEGTRNKGDDPYHLLRARAGVGRIALASPHARIIPAFVLGMSNDLPRELVANWKQPEETRIEVFFGPEIDLGDLRMLPATPSIAQRASERMLDAIRVLGEKHRALVGAPASPREHAESLRG